MEIMIFRRIIQKIGESYMISLPKEWMRNNNYYPKKIIKINLTQQGDLLIRRKNDTEIN